MSFSAEMKDFINAYQAGTKINSQNSDIDYKNAQTDATQKKTARDNDPDTLALQDEQARANLAHTKAATALTGEQAKNAGVSRAYTQALTDRVRKAGEPQPDPGSGLLPPTMGGIGGGAGAATDGPGAAVGTAPALTNTMIPGTTDNYAAGGIIPDGPDQENDDDEDDTSSGIPTAGATGQPLEMRVGSKTMHSIIDPQSAHNAVRDGAMYGVRVLGLQNGVRTARQRLAAQKLAQGAGALTDKEMQQAQNAVDPKHEMTESQRNMAALGAVYQYWANKGEPEKAQKVAFQMLQSYRLSAQNYANMAAKAAQQGNLDLATKAALKAYANVPDGREAQITVNPDGRILYHFTDENGKTITKGLATPQELASSAMGLASHGFDQAILSAAGQRESETAATGKATRGGAGGSSGNANPGNMKARADLLGDVVDQQAAAYAKKTGQSMDPNQIQAIKDGANHILGQNPTLTPEEAVEATLEMTRTSGGNPAATFTTSDADANGNHAVTLKNGRKLNVSGDQFDVMMNQRAQQVAAQRQAEQQKTDEQAASDAKWKRVKGDLSAAGGAISDDMKKFGNELMGMVPDELRQRAKGLPDAAKDLYEDYGKPALRAATDPSVNFGSLTTAIGHGVQQGVNAALQALRGSSQQGQTQQGSPQQAGGAIPSTPDDQGDITQYTGTM